MAAILLVAAAACSFSAPPSALKPLAPAHSPVSAWPHRSARVVLCAEAADEPSAEQLEQAKQMALNEAIQREDYKEAARLKKEIDALATKRAVVAESQAVALLDPSLIERMLSTAGDALVVLHFTSAESDLSNSWVARTASLRAGSQIAGGVACAFLQVSEAGIERLGREKMWVDPRKAAPSGRPSPASATLAPGWSAAKAEDGRTYYWHAETRESSWEVPTSAAVAAAARALISARGIEALPSTQIWRRGVLEEEVSSAGLEEALVKRGARSVAGAKRGDEKLRDRFSEAGDGKGLPSATAVDDIDFTGGQAGYGGTSFRTRFNDVGKTTGGYLPSRVDKPGDLMGEDGLPGPPGGPDRRDRPPGYGGGETDGEGGGRGGGGGGRRPKPFF